MIVKVLGFVLVPFIALIPLIALDVAVTNSADVFTYFVVLVSSFAVVAFVVMIFRLMARIVYARINNGSPRSSWHWLP